MLTLRKRLNQAVKLTGRRLDVIQQDYLLSWVLAGIFNHPYLRTSLVFKGGTALKKCYFGAYRFSEDLDFSLRTEQREISNFFPVMKEAIAHVEQKIREYAPLKLEVDCYRENEPHPHGQEAFQIRAQFPWQREPLTVVMVEISRDECILFPPALRPLIHDYGEVIDEKIYTYTLEEVILEKLRAILQHTKKLHERDWNRSRARDFYDLWSVFNQFQNTLNFSNFRSMLVKKCAYKDIIFKDDRCFFNEKILANVERTWKQWLGPLVDTLPPYEQVISELRPKLAVLINESID